MIRYLESEIGKLAYHKIEGDKKLTLIFLGGFMSDMEGIKALMFEALAKEEGYGFIRFDYAGHGQSDGIFEEGTIGLWLRNTLQIIDELTKGPLLLIGSSMGGWLMLLAALARKPRIKGLIGIAAAPDFSKTLVWDRLDDRQKENFKKTGLFIPPCGPDDAPMPISYKMIQEAEQHLLLHKKIHLNCPVKLFHGGEDKDVPIETALCLTEKLTSKYVSLRYIKDAGHRFLREADLALLKRTIKHFCKKLLTSH